jgi:hypothetical protein
MKRTIIELILNTLGIYIIWFLILKNKTFNLYSKKGFLTFLAILSAVTLIKIKL